MTAHILIYDHTPALLARFSQKFLEAGYKATTRHPSAISIGQVQSLAPDVIIAGYSIDAPKTELGIIDQLRQHPQTARIPVIVATPKEDAIALSFADDLTVHEEFRAEPFNVDAVLARVRAFLGSEDA
jgi:CheY-like chemotaxis protein